MKNFKLNYNTIFGVPKRMCAKAPIFIFYKNKKIKKNKK